VCNFDDLLARKAEERMSTEGDGDSKENDGSHCQLIKFFAAGSGQENSD